MDKPTQPAAPLVLAPPKPAAFTMGHKYRIDTPGVHATSSINLRLTPEVNLNNVIGSVVEGDVIEVLEEQFSNNEYWRKIRKANGLIGWISLQYRASDNSYGVKFMYMEDAIKKQRGVFIAVDDSVSEEQLKLMMQGLTMFMTGALVNPIRGQVTPKVFVTEVSV